MEIPAGRMVGLLGPDGGQLTLLGLLAGARKMQAGTIQVLGGDMADVQHRTAVGPRIAYMPQGLGKNLYAELMASRTWTFSGSCSHGLWLNVGRATGSGSCSSSCHGKRALRSSSRRIS